MSKVFVHKLMRVEWQIVRTVVDQYGEQTGSGQWLASYPTREEALDDILKFGKLHKYRENTYEPINNNGYGYERIVIDYREVLVSTSLNPL